MLVALADADATQLIVRNGGRGCFAYLRPEQADELGAYLASDQLAIRDARIEELEARVAELERDAPVLT